MNEFNGFEDKKISVFDTFVDVLTAPKEIFTDVAESENRTSNYMLPINFSIIISLIFVFIAFSQPAIQYQISQTQKIAMEKLLNEGKLTQEQFNAAIENNTMKPGSPMFFVFSSIGIIIWSFFYLFGFSLLLWISGKIFYKSDAKYLKTTEIVGLTMYVSSIGAIVTLIFVLIFDSIYAGANLSMFVNEFNFENKTHTLLKSIDLMTIWTLFVLSIGLSVLWKTSLLKSGLTILVYWVIFLGLGYFLNFKFS